MELIEHSVNRFNGVVIAPQALSCGLAEFSQRLHASLAYWKTAGRFLVWLEIPIHLSEYIPIAVDAGFTFHHTGTEYLQMVNRLNPDAMIPGYATHYIGVGGVVINERQELLVVSERHRSSERPYYKLPGGALHPGEHLADAVVREVYEETGVHACFEALVALRHWHGYRYGRSDIYFIARLSPLSEEICKQDEEIDDCLWMPVSEYFTSEHVGTFNREIVRAALEYPGVVPTWIEGYDDPRMREFFFPPALIPNHPPIPNHKKEGTE